MNVITGGGAFTARNISDINQNFGQVGAPFTPNGKVVYLQPGATGVQTQTGSQTQPYTSLATAYSALVTSQNNVLMLVGDGTTGGTARNDAATTWSISGGSLIGYCSPTLFSQRARIAPTGATTAFTPFFTISGSGNLFQNISWFDGFNTGTTSQICMVVSGTRNVFQNCQIAGMGDTTSAGSSGSRSLKITGGENLFEDCVIGLDTIARTTTNASLEFSGAPARNVFRRCIFPFDATNAGVLGILGTGAECMDRFQVFDNCLFINNIKSTSTAMTVLGSLTSASPGGLLLYKQSVFVGIGEYGDTNGLANSYIDGLTGAAATSGIAVNPS